MKNCFFILLIIGFIPMKAISQDSVKKDTAWSKGGQFVLTLSQSSFSDWAAGGNNSYSGNNRLELYANYEKERVTWENNLSFAYGISNQEDVGLRKTDDIIELNSKYGVKATGKWYYSATLDAESQLAKGKEYSSVDTIPDEVVSKLMSPFYLNFAVGIDYKPNKHTSLFMSPINSKTAFVGDKAFAERYSIDSGDYAKADIGAIVKFNYNKEIVDNVNFKTIFNVFANYKELRELKDVDLDWEVLVTMQVFKVISVNLNTHLVWDKDVVFKDAEGNKESRLQFKEIFGAGLTYKF